MTSSLITNVTPLQAPNTGVSSTGTNAGMCTLSFQDRVFRFRTNPNEIWWTYDILKNDEETYGGRVTQILGTRMGDLTVKVDIGNGGWYYLMQVVLYLRDLLSDQRNGNPATFEYTTRNWKLNVYSMSIPFGDQMDATVREIAMNFKIQEDVTGVMSQVTMDAALATLQDGITGPGRTAHNNYNDPNGALGGLAAAAGSSSSSPSGLTDPLAPGGPTYLQPSIVNNVDSNPLGTGAAGLNPLGSIPGLSAIPGVNLLGTVLGGKI
jgi:hypothetical protein